MLALGLLVLGVKYVMGVVVLIVHLGEAGGV